MDIHMYFIPWIICSNKPIYLSLLTSPTEKKWEKRCFEVFSHGLEEMHHELSMDGENHKLGDVTSPLNQQTLGLHTSNFCFSFETLYRINLERLFVCFCFDFSFVRSLHYHLCMRKLLEIWVEISRILLLYWEKECLSWFLMTHIVAWFMSFLMSNNLQML